jgi:hypothetical protein
MWLHHDAQWKLLQMRQLRRYKWVQLEAKTNYAALWIRLIVGAVDTIVL